MTFERASDAISNSRRRAAISDETFSVKTRSNGTVQACIVYEPGRSPYFVFNSCQSIRIPDDKPSSSQVDGVRRWRSY